MNQLDAFGNTPPMIGQPTLPYSEKEIAQERKNLEKSRIRLEVLMKRMDLFEKHKPGIEALLQFMAEEEKEHEKLLRKVHDDIRKVAYSQGALSMIDKAKEVQGNTRKQFESLQHRVEAIEKEIEQVTPIDSLA